MGHHVSSNYCLVVDDDDFTRKMLRNIVEKLGFSVKEAADGKDALVWCAQRLPQVIILDWSMPDMDGQEFLEAIREIEPIDELKIIVCTGEKDPELFDLATELGANSAVSKPITLELIESEFDTIGLEHRANAAYV